MTGTHHMSILEKKSYAQEEQDLIASKFFSLIHPSHNIFLDIGAFDGIGFSNSRLFFERGWSGVCVEPVLKNYNKLKALYENTNVITVQAAATDYEGEITLNVATIPWAKEWGSDVSSTSDDALERWPDYEWEKEIVKATTIDKILEDNQVSHVDFVSIDVEGHELSVLRGFDLQKFNPQLLVVEYSTLQEKVELISYMKRQEYISWINNGQDLFFIHKSLSRNSRVFFLGVYQQIKLIKLWQRIINFLKRFKK